MTDANRTAQELPALIEERRRYEGWLAALDARRDSTPQHVFDRVRADYETRLRQVDERLSAHRHAIVEEKTSLESRRSLIDAEEQLRRDERAELELRAHVGEIAGQEADDAFRAVDESIEKLAAEKLELVRRITELDALLETRAAEAPSPAPSEPEPTMRAEVAAAAGDVAPGAPVVAEKPVNTEEKVVLDGNAMHTPGGSFDELAFLNTVVNEADPRTVGPTASSPVPAAGVTRDESVSDSLLSDLSKPGARRSGEAPLGANVPGHTPIVIRTSGAIEQSKTLKCSECGAMNYPTEWYCERCGAELAAL